jgi:hypothetical protein
MSKTSPFSNIDSKNDYTVGYQVWNGEMRIGVFFMSGAPYEDVPRELAIEAWYNDCWDFNSEDTEDNTDLAHYWEAQESLTMDFYKS